MAAEMILLKTNLTLSCRSQLCLKIRHLLTARADSEKQGSRTEAHQNLFCRLSDTATTRSTAGVSALVGRFSAKKENH